MKRLVYEQFDLQNRWTILGCYGALVVMIYFRLPDYLNLSLFVGALLAVGVFQFEHTLEILEAERKVVVRRGFRFLSRPKAIDYQGIRAIRLAIKTRRQVAGPFFCAELVFTDERIPPFPFVVSDHWEIFNDAVKKLPPELDVPLVESPEYLAARCALEAKSM